MNLIMTTEKFNGTKYTVGIAQDEDCENPREWEHNSWELWGPKTRSRSYGDRQPGDAGDLQYAGGHDYIDDALNLFSAALLAHASDAYYALDEGDEYTDVTYEYTVAALKAVGYKMTPLKQVDEGFTVTNIQEWTRMIAIAKIDDPDATLKNLELELDVYQKYCAGECYCVALLDSDDNMISSTCGILGYDDNEFFRLANELISEIE